MPNTDTVTVHLYGHEIDIERVEQRNTKTVLNVQEGDRRWLCVVKQSGELDYIETTWRGDQLADLDEPDWLEDVLVRLAAPA